MASLPLPQTVRTVIQPDPKSCSLKLTRTPLPVPAPDDKDALLGRLGAGDVVDYTAQPLAAWAGQDPARACDMVLDCVGGDTLAGCWSAVGDGGVLLSVAAPPESARPPSATRKPAKSAWFLVEPRGSDLARISSLVDAGLARPLVDSVVDFEHFEAAFQRVQEGHPKGKVVIRVAD